jgi:hypothetical protein
LEIFGNAIGHIFQFMVRQAPIPGVYRQSILVPVRLPVYMLKKKKFRGLRQGR